MKLDNIENFLHGGDYNPEQWLHKPDVLKEDIRLMKLAKVNVVTVGMFSWSSLEPKEGVYTFEWLDSIMDNMYENGIYVILGTPSGGKPPWMVKKYPEVMRTENNRIRLLYGQRQNQCNSSKVFREKVKQINEKLAERYAKHPALILWHIHNELYGECHCEDCQENFRIWLKDKYKTIDKLNEQYNSRFWSHMYSDWAEIESPSPHGDRSLHGLWLDYKRFYSDLSIDFIKAEIDTVKKYNPEMPVTTNMFYLNCGYDLYKMAGILDVLSWDSYPRWHQAINNMTEWDHAVKAAFTFDYCCSMKQKPFLLMESVPSVPSQLEVCKLKRPKIHLLSGIQAIAFGSRSVQYFQWRKSLGGFEKFHGAVVSHNGSEHTRVFSDVKELGRTLNEISYIKETEIKSNVALLFDWDNNRALELQVNLKNKNKNFEEIMIKHYGALLQNYVSVDIIEQLSDFSKYKLIVAPVLYLLKPDITAKIRKYIENGGNMVLTYYSGIVNENDLVYECFPPYSLNDVFGIRSEEIDSIADDEYNEVKYLGKTYKAIDYCDLIHSDNAEILGRYECDFYKGMPAVTKNKYGNGNAYYIAFNSEISFLSDFYKEVIKECDIEKIIDSDYVPDVMVSQRINGNMKYNFIMNFADEERTIVIDGKKVRLEGYRYIIIDEESK